MASAIAAAELRVVQARRDLRDGWRRLRSRLLQPSFLIPAVAAGALVGFSLWRRGRIGPVALPLAAALIRFGMERLRSSAK